MFDLATRARTPNSSAAAAVPVPFDLALTRPTAATSYPYTTVAGELGVRMLHAYAIELESTLATAVVLSLFTDRRAGRDNLLPLHSDDKRGWCGEEFMPVPAAGGEPDAWGSLLWLEWTGKVTPDVLVRSRFAAKEALAWMLRDGVASRVDVAAQWVGPNEDRLAVQPTIWQGGAALPVYDVLWGTSVRRWQGQEDRA